MAVPFGAFGYECIFWGGDLGSPRVDWSIVRTFQAVEVLSYVSYSSSSPHPRSLTDVLGLMEGLYSSDTATLV